MTGAGPQLTPWGPVQAEAPRDGTPGRVLDAAYELFSAQGIRATTMSQLAERAGISRVWLYRYFDNRDAVVRALLGREAHRFLEGLAPLIDPGRPVEDTVTAMFVHAVTTLRGHELLAKMVRQEPEVVGEFVVAGIGPLMGVAIEGASSLLELAGVRHPGAVAETLVRLVVFAVLNNQTTVDYDDPEQLGPYATAVVGALVGPRA